MPFYWASFEVVIRQGESQKRRPLSWTLKIELTGQEWGEGGCPVRKSMSS